MQQQLQIKNPALAAILSFLVSGLGQIYNGQVGKGIIIFVVQVVNAALMAVIIGFITFPVVWLWCIYDAYTVASRINAEAQQQSLANTKKCPECAERVAMDAKVCRFCGHRFEAATISS